MIQGLTFREESLIQDSILTRIRRVQELIEGWKESPDEHTPYLLEAYSRDLRELREIESKLLKP